jgi:hypothetical protein
MEIIAKKWEEKENAQDVEAENSINALRERYNARRNQIIDEYNKTNPKVRPSNETLRMKKVEEGLAKQGK